MKVMLMKTERGLVGATDEDQREWGKFKRKLDTMKPHTFMRFEYSTPRNGKHHRKLFALLKLIAENSEVYNTTEKALIAVKLCAGYSEPSIDPRTGELIQVPRSISYESMGQEDFERFYNLALNGVLEFVLPQMDQSTAERLMDQIIGEWC